LMKVLCHITVPNILSLDIFMSAIADNCVSSSRRLRAPALARE
jgi:hypothetical protein